VLLVLTRLPTPVDPPDVDPVLDRHNWLFIAAAIAFLLLGFVAIQKIGFIPAGIVMVALLMYALGDRNRSWIELIGVSVITPVAINYSLYFVFSIRLPSGSLFP
jgi:hypothetical protein